MRRLRLIELTLLGCLVTPWLSLLPGLPQWGLGWMNRPDDLAGALTPETTAVVGRVEERERLDRAVLVARAQPSQDEKAATALPPLLTISWPPNPVVLLATPPLSTVCDPPVVILLPLVTP